MLVLTTLFLPLSCSSSDFATTHPLLMKLTRVPVSHSAPHLSPSFFSIYIYIIYHIIIYFLFDLDSYTYIIHWKLPKSGNHDDIFSFMFTL